MTPSMGIIFAVMTVLNQGMETLGLDKHDIYDRQEILWFIVGLIVGCILF